MRPSTTGGSGVRALQSLRASTPTSPEQDLRDVIDNLASTVEVKLQAVLSLASSALQSSTTGMESQRRLLTESQQAIEARTSASIANSMAAMATTCCAILPATTR